ncbi:uncharacterized protein [Palaemon carinicauda]|uniref:uncharacterized protein n=1 Tax=Palaemon carinicauda TaxID=392227 RepID=UPI0035B6557D
MTKKVVQNEEKETEEAMNLEDLFSEEDSLDSTQEENSRVSLREKEQQYEENPSAKDRLKSWQAKGKDREETDEDNVKDLKKKVEEDSLDGTQEENSRISPREEEQQANEQEEKEEMDLE